MRSLLWTAEQPEIFALAVDADGALYAGTSPDGKVYRIENGKATEYFAPGAEVHLVAGDRARRRAVCRYRRSGQDLSRDAGRQGRGVLRDRSVARHLAGGRSRGTAAGRQRAERHPLSAYRKNKAFVLYDANLPEIRTIVPTADGTVYAAALGGSVAKRAAGAGSSATGATGPLVTAPATSITVTESNAQAGPDIKPPKPDPSKQPRQPARRSPSFRRQRGTRPPASINPPYIGSTATIPSRPSGFRKKKTFTTSPRPRGG